MNKKDKKIGIGVIGCGRIGSLRAVCSSENAAVSYLAVCDLIEERAKSAAANSNADDWSTDYKEIMKNPKVDAVFISTTEPAHNEIILSAIEHGKSILVEKPLVQDWDEARTIRSLVNQKQIKLFVGYTQRFRRRFLAVKEHLNNGYVKEIDGAFAKIFTPMSQGEAVLKRGSACTPAMNLMTYPIDMMLWYMEDKKPESLYAQTVTRNAKPVASWTILTFSDGTVCTIGASRQYPQLHPAYVCTLELELYGSNGSITIDDSHRDCILVSEKSIPSPYLPDKTVNVAFLGSAMPGDWALGHFYGPLKEETNAFIDTLWSGKTHPVLTTVEQACRTLQISLAIQESAATGQKIDVSDLG